MLHIYTEGGLANRLRSIASAYKLTAEYSVPLSIHWDINPELHCELQKIFNLNNDIHILNRHLGKIGTSIFRRLRRIYHSMYMVNDQAECEKFLSEFRNNPSKDYHITSFSNFYDAHDYSFLHPVSSIDMRVSRILDGIDKDNLIGVQIRRTDNANSIANSPTESFIEAMQNELSSNPNVTFYLATDDIATRQQIRSLFPDKVLCNEQATLERTSTAGMIDAVTDFISLSRCRKIYGSYWSSFCEVAADIGGCELTVVSKKSD